MALFKDFTFDGENSKDYGVYISGDAVYDAPERAMDMVQIPGRNGALALDNGYYNNIDVTYPAGCFADDQADFAAKLSRIRNMLASRHRYCRLEDAYHPDHFRMALYKSGLDVAPVARNKAGRFNIIFDAKPQRFLKSGEVVQEFDADAPPTTSYGPADIVTFEGEPGDAIVHGQLSLEPIQDLHGYGNPWPAGGGKNMLNAVPDSATKNSITFSNADGIITTSGTASGSSSMLLGTINLIANQPYTLSGCASGGGQGKYGLAFFNSNGEVIGTDFGSGFTYTPSANETVTVRIRYWYNQACNGTWKPQVEQGSTPTSYAPFSNICPISGHTEVNVVRTGKNLLRNRLSGSGEKNSLTYVVNADGSITVNGTADATNSLPNILLTSDKEKVPAGSYILSGCPAGGSSTKYRIVLKKGTTYYTDTGSGAAFTINQGENYEVYIRYNSGIVFNNLTFKPMIRLATEADATYEPYSGNTYTIDLDGTRYGGTLDAKTGVLTVDRAMVTISTLSWTAGTASGRTYFKAAVTSKHVPTSSDTTHPIMATNIEYAGVLTVANMPDVSLAQAPGTNEVRIYDSAVTTLSAMQDKYGTGQFVYYLATPITVQLTPTEVTALLGVNNIFSDAGTTTITVQSPYELENPTLYPSKPLIRVYGSGTIQVNNITITVAEHSGYIDIDCDMMDCHRGADNMNQYVSFSGNDFPELQPGINRILLNGPDKVEITPRWWEL